MNHIEGQDRDQIFMASLNDLVHREAFVRIIDVFIDSLDLSLFAFKYFELREQGRPPFLPAVLMKLYLYGYQHGIRSCRKLEHATKVNIEVMWLIKGRRPHYKTIANFRKDNAEAFREVFRHFVAILKDWDLIDGKHIAVDSFKIRAQNSLKNNFNQGKVNRHLDYIDGKINEYLDQIDHTDDSNLKAELNKKVDYQIDKWNNYCEIGEQLLNSGQDQISTIDPDAQAVILHRNIVNVGYNVQAVSDEKHKLLVAMDTGSVNDTYALSPMVKLAQENMGVERVQVLADKGYQTGSQIKACEQLNATTFVSPKASAVNKRLNVFPTEAFKYHPGTDTYRCPNQQILRSNGVTYERKAGKKGEPPIKFKHYKTRACKTCPIRNQCTTSKNDRVIQRNEHQSCIERNNRRVLNNPDYYRQRQQIIEHPCPPYSGTKAGEEFGTFKRQWGFTHTLMRGKENVLGEVSILFTAYNLRRSLSILGFTALIERIKTLLLAIFGIIQLRSSKRPHVMRNKLSYPDDLWTIRICEN